MIRRNAPTTTIERYDAEADPELAQRLPLGYRDRQSPNYIEPEDREAVADYPPARLRKVRRDFYGATSASVRTIGKVTHTINPSDSEQALETVALWRVIHDIRAQRTNDARNAERLAYYDVAYGCSCCGQTATPNGIDRGRHTQPRRLADGVVIAAICGECFTVHDDLARERLAASPAIDGQTRRERAQAQYEAATS